MKNLICLWICLILAIPVNTALALPGSGTLEDPWRIESLADFNEFAADANYWDDWTRLETDVNLAGQTYSTAVIAPDTNSTGGFQGTSFTGIFDGNDYKITGLTIDDVGAGNRYLGLFGFIDGGEVRNLGLEGGSVSGTGSGVGGLVGWNDNGHLSNCHSTSDVSGYGNVGGLVGANRWHGSVSNCYSTGDVNGVVQVGGMVGLNELFGSVSNCYSTGDVNGDDLVGGLLGVNWVGNVSNCYSTGDVSGDYSVGGLVGRNDEYGSVSNCYSNGDVDGSSSVGGLVGENWDGSVSNCHSTGSVSGTGYGTGGLVGQNWDGSVSNCYSTGSVSGGGTVGGLVGYNDYYGSVSNCYSTGDVSGEIGVGGLVGWNYEGSISNCYSTGDVSGDSYVGGLVGFSHHGTIPSCYSSGSVSGTVSCVGGLVGRNHYGSVSNCFWDIDTQTHGVTESIGCNDGTVTNVEGLPTTQMQVESTFTDAGWDFTTPIWKFCSVPDYPSLWWEECLEPSELILDLADDVMALNLHKGITNSLEAKLEAALGALEDENENNDAAAVNTLEAFINAVEAQRGKKIPEAEADDLIAAAQEIIDLLSDE